MKFYPFMKYFLILLVWINLSSLVVDCELPPPKPLFPYFSVTIPTLWGDAATYAYVKDYIYTLKYTHVTKF